MINKDDITDEMLMHLADGEGDPDYIASLQEFVDASEDLQERLKVFSETRSALQAAYLDPDIRPTTEKLVALQEFLQGKEEASSDNVVDLSEHRSVRARNWGYGMSIAASFLVVGIGLGAFTPIHAFLNPGDEATSQIASSEAPPSKDGLTRQLETQNIQKTSSEDRQTKSVQNAPYVIAFLRDYMKDKEPLVLSIDPITTIEISPSTRSECLKFRIVSKISDKMKKPSDWTELCG